MSVGARIETLQTPAFVVDRAVVRNNCRKMLDLAKNMGINLRGQTKTHKTVEAGILQTGGTKR
jgi:D-serine deaminase-like pyridoxal phosphate-dependent protein